MLDVIHMYIELAKLIKKVKKRQTNFGGNSGWVIVMLDSNVGMLNQVKN